MWLSLFCIRAVLFWNVGKGFVIIKKNKNKMRSDILFTHEDASFLWRVCGRIEGAIEMMAILFPDNEESKRIKGSLLKTEKVLMDYIEKKDRRD